MIKVERTEFKGKQYVDIRKYFKGKDGKEYPTRKGIMFTPAELPGLINKLEELEQKVGA
jgi:hypothetical protein